ncbi:MAG: hypothetical protein Q7W30_06455 [Coriobacteriia bacterium]|nr:hypothetical protein [Coriobacteriia bacterium]
MCDNARECRCAKDQGFVDTVDYVAHAPFPPRHIAPDLEDAVRAALASGPATATRVAATIGWSENEVAGALWKMRRAGLVTDRLTSGDGMPQREWVAG